MEEEGSTDDVDSSAKLLQLKCPASFLDRHSLADNDVGFAQWISNQQS